ncbi:MAG: FHA domain-containing protein [Verrucomicrobiae bacterium]|nr:FHA domain-containing protein [Verrucomicrobiae bacterium]
MPKLTIYLPDQEPLKVGFEDQAEVNVGRADDNDIVVVHDSISSHHAQLRLVGGQYHLVDLDSTNGTFLDGAPVTEIPLHHGSRITFGQVDADYATDEVEEEVASGDDTFGDSTGSGFESSIHAAIAQQSVRPADFRNLSPLPKVEKKNTVSQIAMILGIVGLLAALAVAGFALMMKA